MRTPGPGEPKLQNWTDRWAPQWIVFDGKVWKMKDWTAATGITPKMIAFRLHWLGWSEEDALTINGWNRRVVGPIPSKTK